MDPGFVTVENEETAFIAALGESASLAECIAQ